MDADHGAQHDQLDRSLCVDDEGHLSEIAATALADGEHELIPREIRDHANDCPRCNERLGDAALLTLRTHVQIEVITRPSPAVPKGWVAAASVIAILGMLPSLFDAAHGATTGAHGVASSAARASDAMSVLFTALETVSAHPLAPLFASGLLCVVGATLATLLSRRSERTRLS